MNVVSELAYVKDRIAYRVPEFRRANRIARWNNESHDLLMAHAFSKAIPN
jgi:hypothetical protein